MSRLDPAAARQFAVEVVRTLRAHGHQSLWAGGCVRDQLLGEPPKDYDVATDASPERIREIFGRRRTLAVGAAFGVITVLGPKAAGQLDVVTFRRDGGYSDGRHPDSVSFADAHVDAQRRDFTINGLFYDPLAEQVLDYVGGQEDLRGRVVRAIGDPRARIAEDKLRMLRAVRFAARFDFAIEAATLAAIKEQARELIVVSAERIATELRLILTHPTRARGIRLLAETGLLEIVLPEFTSVTSSPTAWSRTRAILAAQERPTFAMALAALLREIPSSESTLAAVVCKRWKLSTEELEGVQKLLREDEIVRTARQQPWPKLQRILVAPRVEELLDYSESVARAVAGASDGVSFCREKLALPPHTLNPEPLITGEDLKQLHIPPGPTYRDLLETVRDAQLNNDIATPHEALALVKRLRK